MAGHRGPTGGGSRCPVQDGTRVGASGPLAVCSALGLVDRARRASGSTAPWREWHRAGGILGDIVGDAAGHVFRCRQSLPQRCRPVSRDLQACELGAVGALSGTVRHEATASPWRPRSSASASSRVSWRWPRRGPRPCPRAGCGRRRPG
jgi:hypothetical protein